MKSEKLNRILFLASLLVMANLACGNILTDEVAGQLIEIITQFEKKIFNEIAAVTTERSRDTHDSIVVSRKA